MIMEETVNVKLEILLEKIKGVSELQKLFIESDHHRKLVAIGELANGISHEFGQPITNIRYTIQFHRKMLEKKAISKEELFEIFDSILEETERMGRINKRLSPITSGKSVIENFDLIDLIQKRVKAENIRLNESKIDVNISPLTPIYVIGDSVKYDQIISNLLLNAIDAIKERQNSQTNRIDIHVEDTIKEIKMIFTDTGIGIHLKDKNKIFSPFFTTKPPGKGEGLGLFIVWNLLKMYGGSIEIDNSYNDGARFLISIPKQTDNQKEA
ncbi:MAG TPA: hypothetical protein DCQ37_01030 [Desulfobacteraceae bacterium]|nr:hypothetical protein [Desulfobacteraceae bacterium]